MHEGERSRDHTGGGEAWPTYVCGSLVTSITEHKIPLSVWEVTCQSKNRFDW